MIEFPPSIPQPSLQTESSSNEDSDSSVSNNDDENSTLLDEYLHHSFFKQDFFRQLLDDYKCPEDPPSYIQPQVLTNIQKTSFLHYMAWYKSGGTVQAYRLHKKVLEKVCGKKLLSLHLVHKLALELTGIMPTKIDMCP